MTVAPLDLSFCHHRFVKSEQQRCFGASDSLGAFAHLLPGQTRLWFLVAEVPSPSATFNLRVGNRSWTRQSSVFLQRTEVWQRQLPKS